MSHKNKSHRMKIIDLCAEFYAHHQMGMSINCADIINSIVEIERIIPENFQERIDKKIDKLINAKIDGLINAKLEKPLNIMSIDEEN